jgi:hypothetical protein
MLHFIKLLAVIVVITYALRFINAQSDLLVFAGLAIAGTAVYLGGKEISFLFDQLKSKL